MYQKIIENRYIVSIVSGVSNGNITEAEYNSLLVIISNKPFAGGGYDYRLKDDLEWELYELPVVEEEHPAYTAEQLEQMTSAELEQICAELGISPNKNKSNMVVLILNKQNEFFL